VYILDKFANLLQFDPSSGTVVATLNFSQAVTQGIAQRFAVTPDRRFAFITVNSAQTAMSTGYVLVADLTSFSIVSTIALPAGTVAGGIAITPDGALAYVVTQPYSGSGPSNVHVINVAARSITTTIPIAGYSNLAQIAITPDGTEAYLVNSIDGGGFSIPVLDLQSNTVQPSVSIFFGSGKNLISDYSPSYIALHPDGTRLYLAPVSGGPVLIVSTITKTVTNVIPLAAGAGPVFGAQPTFTPDGIHLAFTSGMNLVVFVNTLSDTVESSITLPPPPFEPIRNFSFFFVPKP
jgi:DNA-binding beta-propeller fold protein YncE